MHKNSGRHNPFRRDHLVVLFMKNLSLPLRVLTGIVLQSNFTTSHVCFVAVSELPTLVKTSDEACKFCLVIYLDLNAQQELNVNKYTEWNKIRCHFLCSHWRVAASLIFFCARISIWCWLKVISHTFHLERMRYLKRAIKKISLPLFHVYNFSLLVFDSSRERFPKYFFRFKCFWW